VNKNVFPRNTLFLTFFISTNKSPGILWPLRSRSPSIMATVTNDYTVSEKPLGSTRHVRIVTIGAGASGINMIRTLRKKITDYEHVVYDKNPSVGGTWYENRYPGCRCDIPAHNYQFSWKKNPAWSTFFAKAEEIERYLCDICKDEGLDNEIKTSHCVTSAIWDEEKSMWMLKVHNTETDEKFDDCCHFLLDATGILKYVPPNPGKE
jgi:cation diffusion facilitator CzcD-associated flavoprotein CzcO